MVTNTNTTKSISLEPYGIKDTTTHYQLTPSQLHETAIANGQGQEASSGALAINTGEFTGRSPLDRFIVKDDVTKDEIWWGNINIPFKEIQSVDHPINLYAATKKSNELMAHVYSHLFNLPVTGIRFFTVYGPWGRPDMALSLFIKAILNKEVIQINGNGAMERDFTYIEDIIEGLTRLIKKIPNGTKIFDKKNPNPSQSWAPYRIFNMGNSKKELLSKYIAVLEDCLGQKALKEFQPVQPGEMFVTESSNKLLQEWIDFKPNTPIETGIKKFVDWYRDFYKI